MGPQGVGTEGNDGLRAMNTLLFLLYADPLQIQYHIPSLVEKLDHDLSFGVATRESSRREASSVHCYCKSSNLNCIMLNMRQWTACR